MYSQHWKILKIDSPDAIVKAYEKTIYEVATNQMHNLILDLKEFPSQFSVFAFGEFMHYIDKNDTFETETLRAYLHKKGHQNISIHKATATIEDVFMDL